MSHELTSTSGPRVTVGLPVFNGERFLEEAISSVLGQDFENLELVISDNGSSDGTEELCRQFASRDPRVRYYRWDENRGASANYNRVFELARGTYFKWAAHDDVCRPQFVSKCVEALDGSPESTILAYPRSLLIDEAGGICGEDTDDMRVRGGVVRRVIRCLATVNRAGPVFGLIRSSALRKTRLIDTFIASDYVLIAELAMLGEFLQLDEALFLRRIHSGSSRRANATDEEVRAWFDSGSSGKSRLTTRQRLTLEYVRSARRLVLPAYQRPLCIAAIPTTMITRRMRSAAGRCKQNLKSRFLTGTWV